ncbi:S9 family peptidase [Cytophagales bacterium RKSG123]|nr:S9 family peptidase [Xanthovirga aplysinae]
MKTYRNFWLIMLSCVISWGGVKAQDKLTPEKLWELGRVNGGIVSPDGKSVLYGVANYDLSSNSGKNALFVKSLKDGSTTQIKLENSAGQPGWTPDGTKITFILKGQLWEANPDGSGLKQVSQVKGGITSYQYAPTMDKIAYSKNVKVGQNTLDQHPDLPKAEVKIIDDLMYRHWDQWSDGFHSHLFLVEYKNGSLQEGEGVDIMQGEAFDTPTKPFGGAEDYTFSPDGKFLAYVCKKKSGKEYAISTNTDIYLYDTGHKTTKNLTEGMMGYDTHPLFSPDGSRIAWLSMARDGYESDKNEIAVYDFSRKEKVMLTHDWDETVSSFIWGKNKSKIYFLATVNATGQLFEMKVPSNFEKIKEDNIRQITTGTHNYLSLGITGSSLISLKQSMSAPTELYQVDIKTGSSQALTFENAEVLRKLKMGKVERRMVKTTDGKEMLVWVILPPDFDPNKKYPTLLYCQGGPQSPVSQFFSYRWNFQLMAANDYIIVAPNRRGLPGFGREWNEAISGDWGGQSMKDYLAAIDDVAKEPYVDANRLGCVGASYGGYSVFMLAGIHDQRFKAFIAHDGLFDMKSWYGTTEELFFANWDLGGPYWEEPKPKAYTKFNPSNYVQNWDTPILIIQGGMDFRVPIEQGLEAFQAAQLRGIPSKLLYFPEENHWILTPQNGIVWQREFFNWLDRWLK